MGYRPMNDSKRRDLQGGAQRKGIIATILPSLLPGLAGLAGTWISIDMLRIGFVRECFPYTGGRYGGHSYPSCAPMDDSLWFWMLAGTWFMFFLVAFGAAVGYGISLILALKARWTKGRDMS